MKGVFMKFKNKQVLVVGCVAIVCAVVIAGAKLHIDKVNVDSSTKVKCTTVQTTTETIIKAENTSNTTTRKSTKTKKTTTTTTTTKKPVIKPSTSKVIQSTTKKIETTKPKSVFYLSDYERRVVECIVMGESGAESYKGQILVAQCLLNACKKDGLQPSQVRTKYKYSGWNTNPSESVKKAVRAVFDDGYKVTSEYVLFFYAPKYAKGRWHETQKFVCEVGGHRFFAEW